MSIEMIGFFLALLTTVVVICVFFERLRLAINDLARTLDRIEKSASEEHKAILSAFEKMDAQSDRAIRLLIEANAKLDQHIRE